MELRITIEPPFPTTHGGRLSRFWQGLRTLNPIWYWGLNFVAVFAVVVWLFTDARFEASVQWWRFDNAFVSDQGSLRDMGDWWWLGLRNKTVALIALVVAGSGALMIVSLWFGPTQSRSVRAWLIATSIIALWIAILLNWRDITWLGKQYRLRAVIGEFDKAAEELNSDWPKTDDQRPILGQFMAYPTYKPRTLILLTLPEFKNTTTSFSVVEGGDKVIRFELVGAERGDWLEWHPPDSTPADFTSGLGERYEVARYQRLDQHWFLVRY